MDDTISRKAAIEALEEPCKVPESWTDEFAVGERSQWEKDVKALNSLPSAERRGKWIMDGCIEKCNLCGEPRRFLHWVVCPGCGAVMEESDVSC